MYRQHILVYSIHMTMFHIRNLACFTNKPARGKDFIRKKTHFTDKRLRVSTKKFPPENTVGKLKMYHVKTLCLGKLSSITCWLEMSLRAFCKPRPRLYSESVADTHLKGRICHTFYGFSWMVFTRNFLEDRSGMNYHSRIL